MQFDRTIQIFHAHTSFSDYDADGEGITVIEVQISVRTESNVFCDESCTCSICSVSWIHSITIAGLIKCIKIGFWRY